MRIFNTILLLALLFCVSCAKVPKTAGPDVWRKVEFDLSQLDADGLRGPPDGKVSLAYEFCIPKGDLYREQVRAIDSTVQFMGGSRGRIGATKQQCLCIGYTHQKGHRDVLRALAELPYVDRIIQCHFE